MPNPCSLELRGRVVEAVESGATRREALEWFDVSPSLLSVRFRSGWCARRPRRSRGAGGCIHRSLQRPELHRSPRTEITKMESATSASRRRERVALLTDRAHVGAALARASQWIKRRNAPSTRLSIRAVGAVDPVAPQRPHRRSLRSPELHRRSEPEYH